MQDVNTVEVRQRPWEAEIVPKSVWFSVGLDGVQKRPRRSALDDSVLQMRPSHTAPGHTAYLTYARKGMSIVINE
jgi:hypothetical protein